MSTSFQLINIGKFPNDTEGDSLRTAFIKVNENFTDVDEILSGLLNGSIAFISSVSMGNNRIINLGDPSEQTDAANKQYVDNQIQELVINQLQLKNLTDVDATTLDDGSLLVYDESTEQFVTQKLLDKQLINGGNF